MGLLPMSPGPLVSWGGACPAPAPHRPVLGPLASVHPRPHANHRGLLNQPLSSCTPALVLDAPPPRPRLGDPHLPLIYPQACGSASPPKLTSQPTCPPASLPAPTSCSLSFPDPPNSPPTAGHYPASNSPARPWASRVTAITLSPLRPPLPLQEALAQLGLPPPQPVWPASTASQAASSAQASTPAETPLGSGSSVPDQPCTP